MSKTLNLDNLTQPPETEGNPWSTLLFDTAHGGIGATAAHAAIISLSRSWAEDKGENRRFMLTSLEETIKALSSYYWALHLVVEHERLHDENAVLAERIVAGTVVPADFVALGKRLEAMNDLKQKVGIAHEQYADLIASAFAPTAKEEAGAA